MLNNLLTKETLLLHVEATDWQDAIRQGAYPLLRQGTIEERYIEEIINKVSSYGPYIVIAPGIALSHARPEDGAIALSLGLITLKTPVTFGSATNDPVSIVITFSAPDSDAHLSMLAQLMELLGNPTHMETILNAHSVESLLTYIQALPQSV